MAQPIQEPGRTMARDDAGYETARCETVWRTNMPDRFPDRIVQANSVGDVVAAVRAAVQYRPRAVRGVDCGAGVREAGGSGGFGF